MTAEPPTPPRAEEDRPPSEASDEMDVPVSCVISAGRDEASAGSNAWRA